jgi:hypothetical protein
MLLKCRNGSKPSLLAACSDSHASDLSLGVARLKYATPPVRDVGSVDAHERELTETRRCGLGCLKGFDAQTAAAERRFLMRNVVLALLAAGGLAVVGSAPAEAVGTRYPFCIQGNEYPGLSNCTFTSYEQCQATASGRFLYCVENPFYNPGNDADPRGYRGRNRVRSVYPSY